MSNPLESTIVIHLEIPTSLTTGAFSKGPVDWLCEIVVPVVSERDESIDMELLRKFTDSEEAEDGQTRIDLCYDEFAPTFDWKEDYQVVFDDMTDRIKEAFQGSGATGTINICGWYTDPPPNVSSFVRLE